MRMGSKQRGFTMVELVIAIVLMGIIAVGATGFIISSVKGYSDMSRREGIAGTSRVAIDRILREVRNALPNSARTDASGNCLEFVPILAATQYVNIPLNANNTNIQIIPFAEAPTLGRAAVYPITTAAVYQTGSPAVISPDITSAPSDLLGPGVETMTLASGHRFPAESPSKRLFVVDTPVSYCLVGDRLYRYRNYARSAVQPAPSSLPTAEPNRVLLAYPVTATQPFTVVDATLQRNALVLAEFSVEQAGERLLIQQEVQIRNAP